jgi:hypothetical protein
MWTSALIAIGSLVSCGAADWLAPVDDALAPGQILVLGEMHGTVGAAGFAGQLVARAEKGGTPVVLGVEVPGSMQPALDALTKDPSHATPVLAHPFWSRASQDGRSSEAMLDLLETAARSGATLLALDAEPDDPGRDRVMADRVEAASHAHPEASIVVLVGNIHPRRGPDAAKGLSAPPLGQDLAEDGVQFRSLKMAWQPGEAWVCMDGTCGVHAIRGQTARGGEFVRWYDQRDDRGYDGEFSVGPLVASPPARPPR